LLKTPLVFSLKFFWAYFFFYAVVVTSLVGYFYLLPLNDFLTTSFSTEIVNVYPKELVVRLQDGSVSTNVSEPYFIPMSSLQQLKQGFDKQVLGMNTESVKNLLVIDTMAKIEDFPQYQTVMLLTKHHLSVRNDAGNIETISLVDADNVVINRQKINMWITGMMPFLDYAVPVLLVLLFVGVAILFPLGKMLYVGFVGLVLMFVSKIMSKPLVYKRSYQLGLHLVVISTTFFSLWSLFGVVMFFPFLEIILLTILGGVIIRVIR